jgi:hypothetical protein
MDIVLHKRPFSSIWYLPLGGVFVSLGLGWLHPDQQRAPVAIPLFSAIEDSVRQD